MKSHIFRPRDQEVVSTEVCKQLFCLILFICLGFLHHGV